HQNSGQRAAAAAQGVNVNLLASSGVDHVDTISGMSQLTALSVTVTALPQNAQGDDWSGLAAATVTTQQQTG
ncbi:MAG: hypothetical protein AB8B93_03800, partial [Pseudomonadales bacterium]